MMRASAKLSGPRRAVVLMAVMFAVTLIAVAATAVLLRADSESSRTASILRYSQSKAAAWSGVRSVLAELQAQRTKLLQGETPEITGSWALVEAKDSSGVVVRLVDLGPADGTLAQPEASKVNINTVADALLSASGVVSAAEAASIAEGRRAGVLASMTDLIGRGDAASGSGGITVERLYGRVLAPDVSSTEAGSGGRGATSMKSSSASSSGAAGGAGGPSAGGASAGAAVAAIPSAAGSGASAASGLASGPAALADVCTVFSADPNVQVGIAADAARYAGMARINLGLGWTDDLVQPITERFGKDAVETTKQLLQGGSKFKTMRDVVAVLRRLSVPIRQWGSLLDAFTTTSDPFVIGRIDLLRAGEQVLGTVPGIDAAAAGKIVAVRDRLDAAARRELTWPVLEGILTEDQFELAVDWITNRSMQWRVVVEAGRPRRAGAVGAAGAGSDLADRVVLEAVLDVAAPRGRVAYMRDVSALQAMRLIALAAAGKNPQTPGVEGPGVHEFGDERDLSGEGVGGLPGGNDQSTMSAERGGESAAAEAGRAVSQDDRGTGAGQEPAEEPMQDASTARDSTIGQGAAPAVRTKGIDHRTGRWNAPRGQGGRP